MPKVSIIVPVYNVERYIVRSMDSLVNQTLKDIEIIVVNDGSTDNSKKLIEIYQKKYPNKIKLVDKKNGGLSDARNYGIPYATGEYIAFLDADDRFAPGKLKKQVELLEQTGACLCNTARVLMTPDGSLTQTIMHTPEKITLAELEKTNVINCSSVVAPREILLKYPMQHSEVHEDYLTWLQMLRAYPYAVGIDEPLLEYRLSAHGKSRNKLKSARMTYRTYRLAGYPVWKSCRMFLSYMINGLKKYATH